MAKKKKKSASQKHRYKVALQVDEIDEHIEALQQRVAQIEDLTREGFPYRDALRPRIELQIKETIRQIFGEYSAEFQSHKDRCLKSISEADILETLVMLRELILKLQGQRLDLLNDTSSSLPSSLTQRAPLPPVPQLLSPPPPPLPPATPKPVESPPVLQPLQPSQPPQPPPAAGARGARRGPSSSPGRQGRHQLKFTTVNPSAPAQSFGAPGVADRRAPAGPSPQAAVRTPSSPPVPREARPPSTATPRTSQPQPGDMPGTVTRLKKIGDRFHLVSRQLRLRGEYRATVEIEDQKDVQDLYYTLLRYEFEDVRVEEWSPGSLAAAPQSMFFLQQGQLAVIVKKTNVGRGAREIVEELEKDIARHSTHKTCTVLLCFVYDPEGRIGDPRGLERQLTHRAGHLQVHFQIAPK